MNPKYDVIYEVKTDNPIVFEDSANVKLSMAIIADTHLPNRESAEANLANAFEDIANSPEKFDAFLMAGDVADYGTKNEYNRFFRVLDKQTAVKNLFVTMGNHDVRFFYQKNQKIFLELLKKHDDTHLLLIGPVTAQWYLDEILSEAKNAGISARLTVIPGLPPDSLELLQALKTA